MLKFIYEFYNIEIYYKHLYDLQCERFRIPSGPVLKHGPRSLTYVQVIGIFINTQKQN